MNEFQADIETCLEVLNQGGIILYPTDTVWGLGCDATNEHAIKKIFALKKRSEAKSMIVLVENEEAVSNYTDAALMPVHIYLRENKDPVTVIYPKAKNISSSIISNDGSVGIRVPKDSFCLNLLSKLKKPIVSTSANISGKHTPLSFSEIEEEIKKGVDYIVSYRQKEIDKGKPSQIIACDEQGRITVIRM